MKIANGENPGAVIGVATQDTPARHGSPGLEGCAHSEANKHLLRRRKQRMRVRKCHKAGKPSGKQCLPAGWVKVKIAVADL